MSKVKKKVGSKPDIRNTEVSASYVSNPTEDEATEDTKKYSKRRLVNNWAKYERDISEDISGHIQDDRDFNFLERNTSATNFFQLEEEKEWDKTPISPDHGLFSLNVKQLTAGIACLPFYEVLDVDKKFITPENIDRCDKIAKSNVLRYRQDYPLSDGSSQIKVVIKAEEDVGLETVKEADAPEPDCEDDELEEWLDRVLDN